MTLHITHAFPNAWLPTAGSHLALRGLTPAEVGEMAREHGVTSHVRYPDHAERISEQIGYPVPESGDNCPSPLGPGASFDRFVVASRNFDGGIDYVMVWDASHD